MIIGEIVGGKKLELDLPTLVETGLLIQANSGGGKSWLLRLIAERAGIQTIVLDNECEFASLREAVDILLVGAGGELPADPRHAALLARRLHLEKREVFNHLFAPARYLARSNRRVSAGGLPLPALFAIADRLPAGPAYRRA
jgi:hypothetical protein